MEGRAGCSMSIAKLEINSGTSRPVQCAASGWKRLPEVARIDPIGVIEKDTEEDKMFVQEEIHACLLCVGVCVDTIPSVRPYHSPCPIRT